MEAHTKNELVSEYKRRMNYYKGHKTQRNFSKYAEMFWILFNDDLCGHKYAVCCKHKNIASKQYIVNECECLEDATNDLNKWRHSGTDYSYYILDTDNNKILN